MQGVAVVDTGSYETKVGITSGSLDEEDVVQPTVTRIPTLIAQSSPNEPFSCCVSHHHAHNTHNTHNTR